MRTFILIDFSWLYNRYYFAASYALGNDFKGNFNDTIENNLYRMLHEFLTRVINTNKVKVILALDSPTSTLNNFKIFEGYKQNRDKELKKEVSIKPAKVIEPEYAVPQDEIIDTSTNDEE